MDNPQNNDTTTMDAWDSIEAIQNKLASELRAHDTGKNRLTGEQLLSWLSLQAEQGRAERSGQAELAALPSGSIDFWSQVEKRRATVGTGLAGLDELLGGGFEPGRLLVLLGAPGGGKTSLANQMAVHAADSGRPVLYVSSEDSPFYLLSKTLARQSQIDYTAVHKGYVDQRERIADALETYRRSLAAERLHYVDATTGVDIEQIVTYAREHFERFKEAGSGILVIDYLQRLARMRANDDLRIAVTMLTERCRAIASELDCTVLCLASQHRASGYGASGNSLTSGKESGDIEYTADIVGAIGDDSSRMSPASWLSAKVLRVDKNRQGRCGAVQLDWHGGYQQFTEAAAQDQGGMQQPAPEQPRKRR